MTASFGPAHTDVTIFLSAGKDIERGLIALSAAESLTDDVAIDLFGRVDVQDGLTMVQALHFCDFVVERNSEWHLAALLTFPWVDS